LILYDDTINMTTEVIQFLHHNSFILKCYLPMIVLWTGLTTHTRMRHQAFKCCPLVIVFQQWVLELYYICFQMKTSVDRSRGWYNCCWNTNSVRKKVQFREWSGVNHVNLYLINVVHTRTFPTQELLWFMAEQVSWWYYIIYSIGESVEKWWKCNLSIVVAQTHHYIEVQK